MATELLPYTAKLLRDDIKENEQNIAITKKYMASAMDVRETALEQQERYKREIKRISSELRNEKNKDKKMALWTELESYQESLKTVEQVLQTSYVETQVDFLNSLSIFSKSKAIGEKILRETDSNIRLSCSYSSEFRPK
jgi:hypothetical protein